MGILDCCGVMKYFSRNKGSKCVKKKNKRKTIKKAELSDSEDGSSVSSLFFGDTTEDKHNSSSSVEIEKSTTDSESSEEVIKEKHKSKDKKRKENSNHKKALTKLGIDGEQYFEKKKIMEKLERKKKPKNYKEEYVTKDELMLILDNYVLKDKKESKSDKIKRLLTSIEGKNENFNSRLLHKSMQTNSNDSKDSFEDYSNWLKKHNKNDSDTTEETVKIEHPNKEYYNACLTKKVKKYLNDYAKRKAMNEKRKL